MGLHYEHSYAILDIKAVGHGVDNQLICLRNPWGRGEWKGRWSDASSQWTTHAKRICGHSGVVKDDGTFWMCLRDFRCFYSKVAACMLRRMFHQMRWPVELPANMNSPVKRGLRNSTGGVVVFVGLCACVNCACSAATIAWVEAIE